MNNASLKEKVLFYLNILFGCVCTILNLDDP